MKKLLTDIELDFHELKCLLDYLDKNPQDYTLGKVAERSLGNLSGRMVELNKKFEKEYRSGIEKSLISQSSEESLSTQISEISKNKAVEIADPKLKDSWAEKSEGAMFRALSLNDVFRFSRELFNGDRTRFQEVVTEMEQLGDYEQAIGLLRAEADCSSEDLAFEDMDDFLQRYFKY